MAVYEQSRENGTKYWTLDFTWVDPKTGKSKRVRKAAKDEKGRPARSRTAAEQHENRLRAALAAGQMELPKATSEPAKATAQSEEPAPQAAKMTLEDYLPKYLADARVRLKPQTIDYLDRTLRNSVLPALDPKLGERRLDALDMEALSDLTRALHAKKLGAKTINNTLSALRALLAHAVEHKVLAHLPHVKWLKPAPTKFDFFTFDETAKLLEHAPPFVVVALRTGMRIGELVALKWSDVALERKQLTVSRSVWWDGDGRKHEGAPKNNKARTIPLAPDGLEALEALPHRTGYVFLESSGLQLRPTQCKWPLWRAQDAAGLRRTGPHVLRHTFASHLVMRGVPLAAVQALMGHSTIQMTMKYAHLAPDHLRDAIDALTVVH